MSFELVEETESVIALLRNFAEEVPAELKIDTEFSGCERNGNS